MKKKVCLICAIIFVIISIFQVSILATDISLLNNNTALTDTQFSISNSGKATVNVYYKGYPNVTTGATITIKIEKRNFLLFWTDKVTDTIIVTGSSYNDVLNYQLEDTGTYRCTVVYTVSGTGGADDVLTFEDTKTYG